MLYIKLTIVPHINPRPIKAGLATKLNPIIDTPDPVINKPFLILSFLI